MELAADLSLAKLRCAPFHASTGADPIGSAGAYDAFLVVEVPLPWEKDVTLGWPFTELTAKAASIQGADGRRWRPMAVVPRTPEPSAAGSSAAGSSAAGSANRFTPRQVRVMTFQQSRSPDGVGGFQRSELVVGTEEVVDVCSAILTGADPIGRDGAAEPATPLERTGGVDLLICTHGRRDSCCGSSGPALHQELVGRLGQGSGVRLMRCSHTGGHRFAATALSFPDGYAWAHLDADVAERVVTRSVPPADLARHCRGFSGLGGGPAQAADREALVRVGWAWTRAHRRAVVVAHERDTLATTVRVEGRVPERGRVALEVRVEISRWVPTPTCGAVSAPEFEVEPEWVVTAVEELTSG